MIPLLQRQVLCVDTLLQRRVLALKQWYQRRVLGVDSSGINAEYLMLFKRRSMADLIVCAQSLDRLLCDDCSSSIWGSD
ncbi:hypothetical protein [uncultured Shewanella sp.]|uniref:hypothetical protein n=1 Tax=uncultured Shewanella sp. TaxID=173975 RepID=UPI0037041568